MLQDLSKLQDRGRAGGRRTRKAASVESSTDTHGLLELQRTAGNHAVALVVSRTASTTGTVQIGKLKITVSDGNLAKWAVAGESPDSLQVSSQKGGHSAALERYSRDRTRIDSLTVTTAPMNKAGEQLNVGSVVIEFSNARIMGYGIDGTTESWSVADFTAAKRTTTTRKVS
jgi:hypothetical protein